MGWLRVRALCASAWAMSGSVMVTASIVGMVMSTTAHAEWPATARTLKDTPFFIEAHATEAAGLLKAGTAVTVLARSIHPGRMKIEVDRQGGGVAQGYVATADLRRLDNPRVEAARDENDAWAQLERRPWSLGAGFAGSSIDDRTTVVVSADARYLVVPWYEIVTGVDLGFADITTFGIRLGNRFYAPTYRYRPYVHIGYRDVQMSVAGTSAWETGVGLQMLYGQGTTFFDVGVLYLWRRAFNGMAENGWTFGGTSGLRF